MWLTEPAGSAKSARSGGSAITSSILQDKTWINARFMVEKEYTIRTPGYDMIDKCEVVSGSRTKIIGLIKSVHGCAAQQNPMTHV
jgi:hypothetical protein